MHPAVFETFTDLFESHRPPGREILEIGAGTNPDETLLTWFARRDQSYHCVGIDLVVRDPPAQLPYELREMNAHDLGAFETASIDAVICNAVLEHDGAFWRSLAEIRRVLRPGGYFFVGVPGYPRHRNKLQRYATRPLQGGRLSRVPGLQRLAAMARLSPITSTATLWYHAAPRDYYRFSEDAVGEVFMEEMTCLTLKTVLHPVRVIAVGRRNN